jgi:hypothetical protein
MSKSMKSTWQESDASRRWKLTAGFALFVAGTTIAGFCGYMEHYIGDPLPDFVTLTGWAFLLSGLILYFFGILQSPIRR